MKVIVVTTLFLLFSARSFASEYGTIFASANLEYVFPTMLKVFYQKHPNASVHIQYNASGFLAKEILNGVDYDLFLSANMHYPEMIYNNGKALKKPQLYAKGFLVLFVPKKILKQQDLKTKGLKLLEESSIKHIVVANKKEAPYGRATIEALKNAQIYDKVKNKIIYTSDIGSVIDDVIWKHYIGFLSKSALHMLPQGHTLKNRDWIEVDKQLYHPIEQGYVISQKGINNKNAMLFLKFLTSKEGKKIFKEYGYETP